MTSGQVTATTSAQATSGTRQRGGRFHEPVPFAPKMAPTTAAVQIVWYSMGYLPPDMAAIAAGARYADARSAPRAPDHADAARNPAENVAAKVISKPGRMTCPTYAVS